MTFKFSDVVHHIVPMAMDQARDMLCVSDELSFAGDHDEATLGFLNDHHALLRPNYLRIAAVNTRTMATFSAFPDPVLIITGTSGDFTFQYFEIPEFVKFGGPFRANIHKQPGGARQVDSMGPDPGPISWSGIMLTADGWTRSRTLYAMYEAGNKVTVTWNGAERTCIISDLKINYKANNYVEYSIELTEVVTTGVGGAVAGLGAGTLNDLNLNLNNAIGIGNVALA